MQHLSKPLKTLFLAVAALAAALLVAVPANAQDSGAEHAPQPFSVQDTGEDGCTLFYSGGLIQRNAWSVLERPSLNVTGWKAIAIPGFDPENPQPCLPHPNAERQIEFRFLGAGMPLGEHIVPFSLGDSPDEYEFDFDSRIDADTVKVAICVERASNGSTWPGRCGDEQTVLLDGALDEEPYCEYTFSLTHWWNDGFIVEFSITLLGPASTGWQVEIDLPEGTAITSVWNAELKQDGSTIIVTNHSWNGTIEPGGTIQFGFVGSGEPPTEYQVFVDGHQCVPAEG